MRKGHRSTSSPVPVWEPSEAASILMDLQRRSSPLNGARDRARRAKETFLAAISGRTGRAWRRQLLRQGRRSSSSQQREKGTSRGDDQRTTFLVRDVSWGGDAQTMINGRGQ